MPRRAPQPGLRTLPAAQRALLAAWPADPYKQMPVVVAMARQRLGVVTSPAALSAFWSRPRTISKMPVVISRPSRPSRKPVARLEPLVRTIDPRKASKAKCKAVPRDVQRNAAGVQTPAPREIDPKA